MSNIELTPSEELRAKFALEAEFWNDECDNVHEAFNLTDKRINEFMKIFKQVREKSIDSGDETFSLTDTIKECVNRLEINSLTELVFLSFAIGNTLGEQEANREFIDKMAKLKIDMLKSMLGRGFPGDDFDID